MPKNDDEMLDVFATAAFVPFLTQEITAGGTTVNSARAAQRAYLAAHDMVKERANQKPAGPSHPVPPPKP
jgi:hypothetical protein